ncbi:MULTISPECIES: phosphopentomutase [Rhizobium/Agrobacterium group]|uniref:Phosphopentomutase n=2 Tax=Rhizobium/Agrobacterium group TaxID=227290 RepID=DEOB_ALLAM|nr:MULTISPECIES: phosphopentomutase [Rhizobium/Agrobacterium group]B9JYP7.1 RecName: Full=Phosphopentomutase; AltName: Full=Phosphodeoxyribomutase [Allorhizobium ampelinum S4]ACM35143.1 phosphopentomutase [Allorhizobium ampelinum S4]MCF1493311.1 phosphopentomutase [Allorhizobium ampelinum]MUO27928.1 phosphopentomutase [Agrobacterium vitis]MUO41037.1 phosphopentomutase [Agrobacterium vitis]MUP11295.1 phosphopentomutase [Agrobacterium vitis]
MARAFLFVLDSFGVGGAPDAPAYGDDGADTLGHIAEFCAAGAGDRDGLRAGPLMLPNLSALGLLQIASLASGSLPAGMALPERVFGLYGAANEISRGKDTPSGHWEIAGTPVMFDWGYFPQEGDAFPADLVADICKRADLPGILGNCHASGTDILARLGEEHCRTGQPICYTSSDSVFQIAAHEHVFGLERLLRLCEIVRELLTPYRIGRVIARPFIGNSASNFQRTGNRRDYSVPPPEPTLLDRLSEAGRTVHAIGKIGDIFAHQGTGRDIKANGNAALMEATLAVMDEAADGDLVFTNFVDFDMLYGHRRDVPGYAAALEAFDLWLPDVYRKLIPGDMVILTADHGCDPTWRGTDHTRERVPIMAFGPGIRARSIGIRDTYADIGETIAAHLGIAPGRHGMSFL